MSSGTRGLGLERLDAVGWMWARMAQISQGKVHGVAPEDAHSAFYRAKLATARFHMARILPEANTRFAVLMAGKGSVIAEGV